MLAISTVESGKATAWSPSVCLLVCPIHVNNFVHFASMASVYERSASYEHAHSQSCPLAELSIWSSKAWHGRHKIPPTNVPHSSC